MDKKIQEKIEEIKRKIIPVLEKYPIKRAGLFGSVVRGEDGPDSDVDILVEITKNKTFDLFDFIEIKNDVENILRKKVDMIQYDLIKPGYRNSIIANEVKIYE